MSLPSTREATVQPGQPIESALINAVQDAIVQLAKSQPLLWVPLRAAAAATNSLPTSAGTGDVEIGNPGDYLADVFVPAGTYLRTIRIVATTLAGATMTAALYRRTYDATATGQSPVQIGSMLTWNPSETEVRKEIDVTAAVPPDGELMTLDDDSVNPTDTAYRVYVVNSGGTARIHEIKAQIRPLTIFGMSS